MAKPHKQSDKVFSNEIYEPNDNEGKSLIDHIGIFFLMIIAIFGIVLFSIPILIGISSSIIILALPMYFAFTYNACILILLPLSVFIAYSIMDELIRFYSDLWKGVWLS